MHVLRTIREVNAWRAKLRAQQKKVGFVPTMGYLHDGHVSLIAEALSRADYVIVSIFVNPLQFGINEDFSVYPRDEARDLQMAQQAGANAVFLPSADEMYPAKPMTSIQVRSVSESLCGASRPGHFDGVAFVVVKLFNIVQPDFACFGMKDAQQVAVIEQLVNDLNIPVEIVRCPIIREKDGLAMSSRNVYLTNEERTQALILSSALREVQHILIEQRQGIPALDIRALAEDMISNQTDAVIDYVEVRHYPSLHPVFADYLIKYDTKDMILLALAVRFGRTRLIDNLLIGSDKGSEIDV